MDSTIFCGFGGCTTVRLDMQRETGIKVWAYDYNHRDIHTVALTLW